MSAPANGQDSLATPPFSVNYVQLAAARSSEEESLSGVFETRWDAEESDFVIDARGSLQRSDGIREQLESVMHFGVTDSISEPFGLSDYYTEKNDLGAAARRASQELLPDRPDESAPECGPSPVEPARIKLLVEEAAVRHGVDPDFAIAIVATESDFDRNRNSPMGARGPMQLMPATATRFNVDNVCDPVANIEGGVQYLRSLLDEFGNPLLVAAAYNAGERRVYEYGGIPPFAETVGYVAKIVNHQLGLPMPAAKQKIVGSSPPSTDDGEATREVGVIAPRKTGSFVGGVMHF